MSILKIFQLLKHFEIWGNKGTDYLIAILTFFILLIIFKLVLMATLKELEKLSKKTKTDIDDFIVHILGNVKPSFFFFIAIYLSSSILTLSPLIHRVIFGLLIIALALQVILSLQKIIDFAVKKKLLNPKENNNDKEAAIKLIAQLIKISLWALGFILILSNLGVNVTSLIAGLGVGGVAIALALQNILGDIFASFSIFVDKPFKSGDFIIVGSDMGTVEKIGIKSTRLKTLQGQELVVSNRELTESRINNYGSMEQRRVVFSLGVVYETSADKLRKIPVIIKNIIQELSDTKFDRAHFKDYGDFSLNFEIVYFVLSSDYNKYMDIQQAINLKIFEAFSEQDIKFAYPTQVVYMGKSN